MRARLGRDVNLSLVTALVISRLDYCNCVLAGLPVTPLAPLQRVLHAAARLVNGLRPHHHVTSVLMELHWLPIKQRVDYKLCFLVHKATVRQAPAYLTGMLTAVTDVPPWSNLQMATTSFPGPVWNSARGRFLLSPSSPMHGTGCQQNSSWCVPCQSSSVRWKCSCSRLLTVASCGIALLNWTV